MVVTLIVFGLLSFFASGIFHEQCHARAALWLGDPTGKTENRLSWDPRHHIDPWMTVVLPLILLVITRGRFVFGGMKPVRINALNFRNPALGMALSAVVGPLSNFALALGGFALLWVLFTLAPSLVYAAEIDPLGRREILSITLNALFLCVFIQTNVMLGAFNILPLPGLDGSRVLYYFLPRGGRALLDSIEPYAMLVTMFIVFNVPQLVQPVFDLFAGALSAAFGPDFLQALGQRMRA